MLSSVIFDQSYFVMRAPKISRERVLVDGRVHCCGLFWLIVPPSARDVQKKTPQSLERGVFIGGERGT